MRSRAIQLALAATLVGGAIAYAADMGPIGGETADRSQAREQPRAKVKLGGHVRGLYPGARKRIVIHVSNGHSRPVSVRRVRTRVADANPGCTSKYLWVRRSRRARYIAPHRGARVGVRVGLRPSAPDACQNARWPLRFRARVRGSR